MFDMDKINNKSINLLSVNLREVTIETLNSISDDFKNGLFDPAKAQEKIRKKIKPWFHSLYKESKIFSKFTKNHYQFHLVIQMNQNYCNMQQKK